jgi:hypothetical protein
MSNSHNNQSCRRSKSWQTSLWTINHRGYHPPSIQRFSSDMIKINWAVGCTHVWRSSEHYDEPRSECQLSNMKNSGLKINWLVSGNQEIWVHRVSHLIFRSEFIVYPTWSLNRVSSYCTLGRQSWVRHTVQLIFRPGMNIILFTWSSSPGLKINWAVGCTHVWRSSEHYDEHRYECQLSSMKSSGLKINWLVSGKQFWRPKEQ